MDKQAAKQEIDKIKERLKVLEGIVEAPEHKLWRPQVNDKYICIGMDGRPWRASHTNDTTDYDRFSHGNCYRSDDEIAKAAPFISIAHKVCAAALQVDPDAGEWIKGDREWAFSRADNGWICYKGNSKTEQICVHTREQARQVADILNAEGV